MDQELLQYNRIVEDALRSVVRTSLEQVATYGLPGEHSLYVTFEGAVIESWPRFGVR